MRGVPVASQPLAADERGNTRRRRRSSGRGRSGRCRAPGRRRGAAPAGSRHPARRRVLPWHHGSPAAASTSAEKSLIEILEISAWLAQLKRSSTARRPASPIATARAGRRRGCAPPPRPRRDLRDRRRCRYPPPRQALPGGRAGGDHWQPPPCTRRTWSAPSRDSFVRSNMSTRAAVHGRGRRRSSARAAMLVDPLDDEPLRIVADPAHRRRHLARAIADELHLRPFQPCRERCIGHGTAVPVEHPCRAGGCCRPAAAAAEWPADPRRPRASE